MELAVASGPMGSLLPVTLSLFSNEDESRGREAGSRSAAADPASPGEVRLVQIRMLGTFRAFDTEGNRVDPGGIPGDVLKLVSLVRDLHVDEVVDRIWPDSDLQTGRRRLRNVLNRIRSSCGDVVLRDGETLRLSDAADVDAHTFEAEAQRALALGPTGEGAAIAETAVAIYQGELLPADRYRDWTAAPRERLRKRFVALLDLLSEWAAHRGELEELVWLVDTAIELEPYDEHRYLRAAGHLSAAGRQGRAAMLLTRAKAMLDDLGVTPSHRFLSFERSLRDGEPPPLATRWHGR